MPARWILCPVVWVVPLDDVGLPVLESRFRAPKLRVMLDPGSPKLTWYNYSAAISDGISGSAIDDWCLCFVRGYDFSPLDLDPEITTLVSDFDDKDKPLEKTLDAHLDDEKVKRDQKGNTKTKEELKTEFKDALAVKAVDLSDLTDLSLLWQWLERCGKKVSPSFTPRGTWVKEKTKAVK